MYLIQGTDVSSVNMSNKTYISGTFSSYFVL